jgi:hypothetical protein
VLLGLQRPPYGRDGYTRFLPDESRYDAARAAANLSPAVEPDPDAVEAPVELPALALLGRMLSALPAETRAVLVSPPLWVGAQGAPGSEAARQWAACRAGIAALVAARPNTVALDYRRPSGITREPTNFWDEMHYRDAVAERMEADIAHALRGEPGPGEARAAPGR